MPLEDPDAPSECIAPFMSCAARLRCWHLFVHKHDSAHAIVGVLGNMKGTVC